MKVSELKQHRQETQVTVKKKVRNKVVQQKQTRPTWVSPVANYRTPMCAAVQQTTELLTDWTAKHPRSYPPTVINVSDGAQTDGTDAQLLQHGKALRELHTLDGHVLFLNCHIQGGAETPVLFPKRAAELPDNKYARLLYDLSSPMPAHLNRIIAGEIKNEDFMPDAPYVGMAYAQGAKGLLQVMDIGTRQTQRAV